MRINIYQRIILGDPYLEMSSSDSGSNRHAYVIEKWDDTNEARRFLVDVRFSCAWQSRLACPDRWGLQIACLVILRKSGICLCVGVLLSNL